MNNSVNVIWQKGDEEMPEHAKHIVETAQDELLLKALQLPVEMIDMVRYNADKNEQTINNYISSIVIERLKNVS